jgi:NAD(P)-dependent dehydrogenase (short-subunit alcohol dehydrogenase family)
VSLLPLDVSSPSSISAAAASVSASFPAPLYGIVNNAGVGFGRSIEETVLTNTLGPMRVFEAFRPLLDPDEGRVVNVASASGPNFVEALGEEQKGFYRGPREAFAIERMVENKVKKSRVSKPEFDNTAYGFSKALLNCHTMEIAERNPSLIINSCTPGWIDTDLTRGMGARDPPSKGTRSVMKCLFDCESRGHYYGSDGERSPIDHYREPGTPPYAPASGY